MTIPAIHSRRFFGFALFFFPGARRPVRPPRLQSGRSRRPLPAGERSILRARIGPASKGEPVLRLEQERVPQGKDASWALGRPAQESLTGDRTKPRAHNWFSKRGHHSVKQVTRIRVSAFCFRPVSRPAAVRSISLLARNRRWTS